jgi:hypothetical protein
MILVVTCERNNAVNISGHKKQRNETTRRDCLNASHLLTEAARSALKQRAFMPAPE